MPHFPRQQVHLFALALSRLAFFMYGVKRRFSAFRSKRTYPSRTSAFTPRRKFPFKRGRFAKRKPFNDDPETPFIHHPLSSNRNEFYSKIVARTPVQDTVNTTYRNSFFINYPTYFVNDADTITTLANIPANYDNLINLFDEYCVMSMSLQYIPIQYNVDVSAASTAYRAVAYTQRDLIDPTNITTEGTALNGAGVKVHSLRDGFRRYVVPQNRQWYSTVVFPNSTDLIQATAVPPNSRESLKLFIPGIVTNDIIGSVIVTWYVRWRGLTSETT